jgi:putative flippase GtrA
MEVTDEVRRSRLTVFFRLALAVPHLVWLSLWGVLALLTVVFNWFAVLFTGIPAQWAHRFLAAYLRYQTHVFAFLYLVANPFPGFVGAADSYPVELHIAERARQNRWTAFFRLVLAFPALLLAGVFSQVLLVVAVLGWFAGLFTGEMPLGLRNLGAFALRYTAQAYGYVFLLTGAYPYSGPCLEVAPAPATDTAVAIPAR